MAPFSQIPALLLGFPLRIADVQLGFDNRFQTNAELSQKEIVLRRSQKPEDFMDDFDHYQNDLCLDLDRIADRHRNHMVESITRIFRHALHRRFDFEHRIPIGARR